MELDIAQVHASINSVKKKKMYQTLGKKILLQFFKIHFFQLYWMKVYETWNSNTKLDLICDINS